MSKIFQKNKYKTLYFKIIENSKNRTVNCYTEKHHIIPKSLGGSNDKSNIAILTSREHFICHYLLCKMVKPKSKEFYSMIKAFTMMKSESSSHNLNRYFNSKLYETFRNDFSIAMSISQIGSNNSQYGTIWVHRFDENLNEIPTKIKKSDLEEYLSNGYFLGRKNKTKFKIIRYRAKKETIAFRSKQENENVKIFHPLFCEFIDIKKKFIYDYIVDGWLLVPNSPPKGRTRLTKNNINIALFLEPHINMFINMGWSRGVYAPNHKGTTGKTYSWINGKKVFN